MIVYRAYIRAVYEGLIRGIHLEEAEADVIVERLDGTKMFLEVFCVMPSIPRPNEDGKPRVYSVMNPYTNRNGFDPPESFFAKSQNRANSRSRVRTSLLIELNDVTIAGDFAVLSSLSGGYKVNIGRESLKILSSGYDWESSVFDDPSTKCLKGVIYFSLGKTMSRVSTSSIPTLARNSG